MDLKVSLLIVPEFTIWIVNVYRLLPGANILIKLLPITVERLFWG